MAKAVFENLTPEQADGLTRWFGEQGEQYCDIWFEINGIPSPTVDSTKGKVRGYNGSVTVFCKQ